VSDLIPDHPIVTAMQQWPQGHVNSNGVSLRYFRSPSIVGLAKPPLVFVHGFTDCALYFARAAETFSADWDVVAYDARGHGLSDRVGTSFDDEKRVADLLAVVTQLGLDRPAMIGHSMGGSTIAKFAAEYPQHTRSVVLEDPAWFEPTNEQLAASAQDRAKRTADWLAWIVHVQTLTRENAIAMRTHCRLGRHGVKELRPLPHRRCCFLVIGPTAAPSSPKRWLPRLRRAIPSCSGTK
jgi:pimeloyl-ACP methyl ester carboxylesterase